MINMINIWVIITDNAKDSQLKMFLTNNNYSNNTDNNNIVKPEKG